MNNSIKLNAIATGREFAFKRQKKIDPKAPGKAEADPKGRSDHG